MTRTGKITRTVTALRRGEHEDAWLKMCMDRQARALATGSHAASAAYRHPAAAPAEREDQGLSSQIKVQEIHEKKPADVPSAKPAAPRPPGPLPNGDMRQPCPEEDLPEILCQAL